MFFIVFFCLLAQIDRAQTINQLSDKTYSALIQAKGATRIHLLNQLVNLRKSDSSFRALELAKIAVEEAGQLRKKEPLTESYISLAAIYLILNQPDSALPYLKKSGALCEKENLDRLSASCYYNFGKYYFIKNDLALAETSLNKAIFHAKQLADDYTVAISYVLLAKSFLQSGSSKRGLESLLFAEYYFDKSRDTIQLGPGLISLGLLFGDVGLKERAIKTMLKATEFCQVTCDSLYLGYVYTNIAGVFYSHDIEDESFHYLNKALGIFQHIHNEKGAAYTFNIMGMHYFERRNNLQAISCFSECLILSEKAGDFQQACFAACNLTDIYTNQKNLSEAEVTLRTADECMRKSGDLLAGIVFCHSNANYYAAAGKQDKAFLFYKQSLDKARKISNMDYVLGNLHDIAELYQSIGSQSLALKYFQLYSDIKDSIQQTSASLSIADMRTKYESRNKASLLAGGKAPVRFPRDNHIIQIVFGILTLITIVIALLAGMRIRNHQKSRSVIIPINLQLEKNEGKMASYDHNIHPKKILNTELQEQIWQQLNQLMESEKPFLSNNLTLIELARKLNTNSNYLSKVINDTTGKNFNQYINHFRIEEACKRLSGESSHYLTIEGIALSVGFKSKSAFNTAFKKSLSITPSEYLVLKNKHIKQVS